MRRIGAIASLAIVIASVGAGAQAQSVVRTHSTVLADAFWSHEKKLPNGKTRFHFRQLFVERTDDPHFEGTFADLSSVVFECDRNAHVIVIRRGRSSVVADRGRCVTVRSHYGESVSATDFTIDEAEFTTAHFEAVFKIWPVGPKGRPLRKGVEKSISVDWMGVGDIGHEETTRDFEFGDCERHTIIDSTFRRADFHVTIADRRGRVITGDDGELARESFTSTSEGCQEPGPPF